MKYSVVIPMYNSGEWIRELTRQITQVMSTETNDFEIVLVNDASPDKRTWDMICEVASENKHIHGIDLAFNAGQIRALICGLENAKGDFIITMDDDFQHSPSEIPKLIKRMESNPCDCVIAKYDEKKHNIIRRLGSRLVNNLAHMMYNKPKEIVSNSYRIMTKALAKSICEYRTNHPQMGPIIFSLTRDVCDVTVEHKERKYGESGYKLGKMISETYNMILSGSTILLDIVSIMGVITSCISFLIGFVYIVFYLAGKINVPGFTATILVITFFSGLILLSIGIVGTYIGRIVEEVTGPPRYCIRSEINQDNS